MGSQGFFSLGMGNCKITTQNAKQEEWRTDDTDENSSNPCGGSTLPFYCACHLAVELPPDCCLGQPWRMKNGEWRMKNGGGRRNLRNSSFSATSNSQSVYHLPPYFYHGMCILQRHAASRGRMTGSPWHALENTSCFSPGSGNAMRHCVELPLALFTS